MSHDHLHLLLNHVPTVGAVAALGLLLLSFVRRNEHLARAGLEVALIEAALAATGGNQVAAARLLGMSRSTLRAKLPD